MRTPTRTWRLPLVAALAAASTALAGCSGGNEAARAVAPPSPIATTEAPAPPSPEPSPTPVGPPSPITGQPTAAAQLERRVLGVKIDNHRKARPQTNLGVADGVVEIIVEGGMTRFVALFHHSDATYLGPMRSGRPTDATVLEPLGATLAVSGGQDWVKRRIAETVPLIDDPGAPMSFRVSERRAPHNLFTNTLEMREEADRRGFPNAAPATGLWTFGDLPASAAAASTLTLDWSDNTTVTWSWDGSNWVRSQDGVRHDWVDEDGTVHRVAVDTLVVLVGRQYGASVPGEGAIPAIDTVGEGRAFVLADGRLVEGTWSRSDTDGPFDLRTADGAVLTVPAGSPWLSVFPAHRSVTWE